VFVGLDSSSMRFQIIVLSASGRRSPTYAERKASKASTLSNDEDDARDEGKAEPVREFDIQTMAFADNRKAFVNTILPTLDSQAPLKERLTALEDTSDTQARLNALNIAMLGNVGSLLAESERALQQTILTLQENVLDDVNAMKREYDHKFELQGAENKRLQNRIAELKEENAQLQRKLDLTARNLQALQSECGVKSDYADEFFNVSTMSMASLRSTQGKFRGSTAPN
jgi:hypothetical protein